MGAMSVARSVVGRCSRAGSRVYIGGATIDVDESWSRSAINIIRSTSCWPLRHTHCETTLLPARFFVLTNNLGKVRGRIP